MTNPAIFVSFCNQPEPTTWALLRVRQADESVVPVFINGVSSIKGANGLASESGHVYVLLQSRSKNLLASFRRDDFRTDFVRPLVGVADGHSILVDGRFVYVASTGTDEVIRFRVGADGPYEPETIWRASVEMRDTHHINALAKRGNQLLVSAFGSKKTGDLWASATDGYVIDANTSDYVIENVPHPHSVTVNHGRVYYCESGTMRFCSEDGFSVQLYGYIRGAAWLDRTRALVGSSVGRHTSRSKGVIANPADPGRQAGKCAILEVDVAAGTVSDFFEADGYGREIYDCVVA